MIENKKLECNLFNTKINHLEIYTNQNIILSDNSVISKITQGSNFYFDNWEEYYENSVITIKSGCSANISTQVRDNEYITLNIEDGAQVTYF